MNKVRIVARKTPTGEIVKRYESIREAMNDMNIIQWRLYHAMRMGEEYEGYYWERVVPEVRK